ncbi:MAG: hypothetical protein SOU19_05705 [Candidatus Caccosoma sp.]|nr:hypothetical protein [Candidatus Caccosoma sp.]
MSFASLISFLKIESLLSEYFLHAVSRFVIASLNSFIFSLNNVELVFPLIASFNSFLAFSKFFATV